MSAPTPSQPMADRNLLFGILALQMDFISRDALIQAMHAWVLNKAKPLGQILLEQEALTADTHGLLESMVQKHLELHDNAPDKSLMSAIPFVAPLRHDLEQLGDADLCASLALVPAVPAADTDAGLTQLTSPPGVTRPLSLSAPTPSGQRFRILRPHAKGGLGAVFVAHDSELHREVALKEIHNQYAGHRESRSRFLLEAEITGGLEHPGVVPVYGLGQYADGRPFYAMRFIKGESLHDAIQRFHKAEETARDPGERTLALRELLGRFVAVCNAIAYAHSRGVVHRDVKPDNIMLGPFGETLVVDWGLAKVIGRGPEETNGAEATLRPPSAGSLDLTRMGARYGTPAYMSPEQAEGRPDLVGPASDIYSLGATLYILLAGRPAVEGSDLNEVLRKVSAGDWLPPRQRNKTIPAPLDAICRKAMAREPERRYPTALAMADDVEHFLADEPVTAYREPRRVRAGRWMRRHKPMVAAATAALLAVLVLGGVGVWWHQRQQERTDQSVVSGLIQAKVLEEQAQAAPLRPDKYSQALEAARMAEKLAEGASANLRRQASELVARLERGEKEAKRDRQLLAALLEVRGPREGRKYTRDDKGLMTAQAEPTADEQFTAAFRSWGLDVDATPTEEAVARLKERPAAVVMEVVAALDEWASERRRQGKPKAEWQRLIVLAAALDEPDSKRRELREILVRGQLPVERALGALSVALRPVPIPVEVPLGEDRARLRRLAERMDPGTESVLGLWTLTRALQAAGEEDLAERLLRAAIQARPRELVLYHLLGQVLTRRETPRWREAIECYAVARALRPELGVTLADALIRSGRDREGLELLARLVKESPDNPYLHFRQGYALQDKGRRDEAIACYKKTIELDPKDYWAHNNLGLALKDQGRLDEAIAEYRKAIALDPKYAWALNNLRVALKDQGRLDEAISEYRKAIALNPKYAAPHRGLGIALSDQGRIDEAIAEYRKAIDLDPKYAWAHNNLGNAFSKKGQQDEAIAEYRKAIELDPKLATPHNGLGNALKDKGRLDEAIAEYRQAIDLDPKDASSRYNLLDALVAQHWLDEANAEYRKWIDLDTKNAAPYDALGNALYNQGRIDEAIAEYRKAIELDPKDAGPHNGLGSALIKQGRPDEAITEFRKAIELDPKFAAPHNNLGNALKDKGRPDEAIAEYRKAIDLDPKLAAPHNNLGIALSDQRRIDEAIAEYRKAIALDPKFAWAHTNLGNAFSKKGQQDEAMAEYRKAIELDPKLAAPHHGLGNTLKDKGRLDEAVAEYRKAIALDPKFAWAHNNLGNAFSKKGQQDEAIAEYRKAIALDPKFATPHNGLGIALEKKGQRDEAIAEYRKAIDLDPKDATPHFNLGSVLGEKGQRDEAIAEYRQAIALDPKYAEAHYGIGRILTDKGQREEAIQEYRKAIELDPKLIQAHIGVGVVLATKGQPKEAIEEYRQAIALDPKNANAHYNLGQALKDTGQLEEAIKAFRQAIALDPKKAGPHNQLGYVLRKKGQLDEAIAEYRKGIALDPNVAWVHNNLGNVLHDKHDLDGAIACYQKAIALDPKYAQPHNNLGNALKAKGRLDEAIGEFRQAIKLDPKYTNAHINLGNALKAKGQWEEAIAEYQKAITLYPANDPLRQSASQRKRQCEQMLALDKKLPGILKGEVKPADTELIDLARLCRIKKRYISAAHFFADAFAAQPKLADDLQAGDRYNAACVAALAASGQGEDAAKLDDKERARWRKQALDWLRADLALWAKLVESGKAEDRIEVRQKLQHWQRDRDLAGLRDADPLAKLPESERAACQKLWADVAALLKKCAEKDKP